jgi:hypothetical protein
MRFSSKYMISFAFAVLVAACGDDDAPPPPVDAGSDLTVARDASTGEDASAGEDASVAEDAGEVADMCPPPLCPKPPPGCMVEPSSDPCVCGTVKCDDAGMGGMMGEACGGRAGACGPGLFCNFPADFDCGEADGMGVCEQRPEICSRILMPVCGCDGNDYSNACEAQSAGTDVKLDGMCPAPDCRTEGCPAGSTCEACRGAMGPVYACIPMGAAC